MLVGVLDKPLVLLTSKYGAILSQKIKKFTFLGKYPKFTRSVEVKCNVP